MSVVRILSIVLMLLVSVPAFAADFYCPKVVTLPRSLNIGDGNGDAASLVKFQDYLDNLVFIRNGYERTDRRAHKNQIANCLMGHLVTLEEQHSLTRPLNEADAATFELLREEVLVALDIFRRDLRHKPELPFILRWVDSAVVNVASR